MSRIFFPVVSFIALLLFPIETLAFKLDTHVWIGQQVLNDVLPDGKVTIEPFGEFAVDPEIVNALSNEQDKYLMGTIGPDGFPDLVGGQMTTHPGVPGGWPTDSWLQLMLLSANKLGEKAFAYGYLTHAASDMFAHTYVNTYSGDIFDLKDEQEVELRHMALEEYIKLHMPPITDNNGKTWPPYLLVSDPAPAQFLRDTLILNRNVADEYRKQPATMYLSSMYDFWEKQKQAIEKIDSFKAEVNGRVNAIQGDIDWLQAEIDNKIQDFNNFQACAFGVCVDFPNYSETLCYLGVLEPTLGSLCITIASTKATLEATKVSLEVPKRLNDATFYSLSEPMRAWNREVEKAMTEYIKTSQVVAIEIMAHGDPKGKIDEWLCNWAPVFVGVPNVATMPGCSANSLAKNFTDGVNSLRAQISADLGALGWLVDPAQKVNEIVDTAITPELERLGVQLAEDLTGHDSTMVSLIRMRTTDMSSSALETEFGFDSSTKGLLEIRDVANRVDADMHLFSVGKVMYWNPSLFNPVYNAVVLSKLVLLGPSELNRMLSNAGVQSTIYGTSLYDDTPDFNILFDAVRSIDGNHQWQEYGIPSPRRTGYTDSKTKEERSYGYSFAEGGFRLWQDCGAREKVFKRIFHGPLAPGIEAPSLVRLTEILPAGDSNIASLSNPFPLAPESGIVSSAGDLDADCDVDQNDLNILLSYRSQLASACPSCDLDGDGTVTGLDGRKLALLCTRPRCATQ